MMIFKSLVNILRNYKIYFLIFQLLLNEKILYIQIQKFFRFIYHLQLWGYNMKCEVCEMESDTQYCSQCGPVMNELIRKVGEKRWNAMDDC